jgi:hypothetical protein
MAICVSKIGCGRAPGEVEDDLHVLPASVEDLEDVLIVGQQLP